MDEGNQVSVDAICRTCLSTLQKIEAHNLFVIPGLAKKFCVCTSLSVEQQDGFPKCICTNCYNRLNDLHNFQKQCVESIAKLIDMLGNNHCTVQAMNVDNIDVINVALQDKDIEVPQDIDVPIEDEERINFDPLLNTKIEIIDNEDEVFKMIENVDKEANGHQQEKDLFSESEHKYNDDVDVGNNSDSDDAMPLSRLRSTSRVLETKIKNTNIAAFYNNSSSSEVDTDKVNLSKRKVNTKRIPAAKRELHIDCHICHQQFRNEIRYEEHMKHHNDLLPFQCTVETCKKGFTTAAGLRHHIDHAHRELCELHACTVEGCDQSFPRTRMLTHHLKKVHNICKPENPVHPCSDCDKVFRCPTALKKHMYKHTGEELPISCNICNKRFHINSELRDHLLRHAGVKNHVCPYCGVGKTTRQEWNKHILTHTKEKQFQCRQCDHASHNKQALANHVKVVHMKIKNFACQYCGKTFGKMHACKVHERLHTGENCCECKICGKIFLFEKRLTKHLQIHEKREIKASNERTQVDEADRNELNLNQESTAPADAKAVDASAARPKNSHRVERVDMSQLAGTSVNPITSVSVPSWSPQVNFTKKEGQHICPGCGRGFNHIGNMKLHYKVVHDKIKDFACRYCPKRFGKAQYLRHHEYTHTGERPYGCKLCDKHFSHGSSLRKHMISHNRPPKTPKPPKATAQKREHQRPKIELNQRQPKNYEQYQDPAAERAAATAELFAQKIEESEAKRRAEDKTRKIQEAACEQLQKLQREQLIEKVSYDSFQVESSETGIRVGALKAHQL
ncbi:PREDICTED: zinc finger protein 93-like [Drosophila arizonae]|uniref:Zinc finger protein 93-like n=1 Tax=Drosophila arizonae TaxID=7263 RepID=A0ABM1P5P0_DROAR|nr:PREDICTED: zinc finger protein 93-like [Drosophila arizonae]